MPYPSSDEESSDSDTGVRFKTTNIRNKSKSGSSSSFHNSQYSNDKLNRKKYRNGSPERHSHGDNYRRSRDSDRDKYYMERKKEGHSSRRHKRDDNIEIRSDRTSKTSRTDRESDDFTHSKYSGRDNIRKHEKHSSEDVKIRKSNDNLYGPPLPDSISNSTKINIDKKDNSSKEKDIYGPTIPNVSNSNVQNIEKDIKIDKSEVFGPTLPAKINKIDSEIHSDEEDDAYGPALPPPTIHNKKELKTESEDCGSSKTNDSDVQLESQEEKNSETVETKICEDDEDTDCFGPSLPPKTKETTSNTSKRTKILGPTLPDHVILQDTEISDIVNEASDSDEDMNIIGPLPANIVNTKLEERALEIKLNSYNTNVDIKTREEWMLELPEVHSVAKTLGPRTFRSKEMPDMSDRSSWTEINGQKATKPSAAKADLNTKYIEEKNAIQEKIVEKHKKNKRCKSLVDMHTEELQKKKAKEKSNERRPFSRDVDLQVNRFDAEHSKSVIRKAHLLDSRFSSGQSKFL